MRMPSPPFRDAEGGTYEWPTCYACERMRRRAPIAVDEHRRLAGLTTRTPKMTLLSPSAFHFFRFNAPADRAIYPDDAQYWDDLVAVYREEITALGEAGCSYLQLDEVPLASRTPPLGRAHRSLTAHLPPALAASRQGRRNPRFASSLGDLL